MLSIISDPEKPRDGMFAFPSIRVRFLTYDSYQHAKRYQPKPLQPTDIRYAPIFNRSCLSAYTPRCRTTTFSASSLSRRSFSTIQPTVPVPYDSFQTTCSFSATLRLHRHCRGTARRTWQRTSSSDISSTRQSHGSRSYVNAATQQQYPPSAYIC